MSDTPHLAYIGSLARSGSTLLELLLATSPDVTTVGELQSLPHELSDRGRDDLTCGCGVSVGTCPFWIAVTDLHDPRRQPPPRLDHFREHFDWGHTVRPGRLLDATRPLRPRTVEPAAIYYANTMKLVRAVAQVSESISGRRPKVVVDSSKDPYRATWLAKAPGSDVRVIHLVRDPRGNVCSLVRDRRRAIDRSVTVARRAAAWRLEHSLLAQLGQSLGDRRYRVVRYEDLVERPDEVVGELSEFLDVEPDVNASTRFREIAVHTIAGNPMRADRRPISADHRWRDELSASEQRIVSWIAGRAGRRCGYLRDQPTVVQPRIDESVRA